MDEGARGADNQSFWVKLGSIDDDNASGMLYDDIAQAKINLNAIGDFYEVDNFTVISTDNDSSGLNVSTSSCGLRKRIPECHLDVNPEQHALWRCDRTSTRITSLTELCLPGQTGFRSGQLEPECNCHRSGNR